MNYRKDLVENILPFWLKNAIDYENGGIYTCLDREGNIYGTDKSVWFQGRALWVFSKAYNLIEKNEEYLKAAKAIYSFLPKCTDTDGRMFFTVTADGRELQKRSYYFSETFAAIGCAELYKATGDEKVLADAEKYYNVALECFKGIRKTQPKFNAENHNFKALSPVMIMLATAQVLRKINAEKYGRISKEMVPEILLHLTEKGLLENVSPEGEFVDTPVGRTVNPGHSLEAAWFLMAEGQYQNNEELTEIGKRIIDASMDIGCKNNGIIAFCDCLGKPPKALEWDMYLWWPQCEAMIANLMAYKIFGEKSYLESYECIKEFAFTHFADNKNGEWYGYLHYDNTVSTTLKGNIFKGPFHIPRLYMIMASMDETNGITEYMK